MLQHLACRKMFSLGGQIEAPRAFWGFEEMR